MHTSRWLAVSANSTRAFSTLSAWNSKLCRCPRGATVRASACDSEPEPVPLSTTTLPGHSSSCRLTIAMSKLYRIWVLKNISMLTKNILIGSYTASKVKSGIAPVRETLDTLSTALVLDEERSRNPWRARPWSRTLPPPGPWPWGSRTWSGRFSPPPHPSCSSPSPARTQGKCCSRTRRDYEIILFYHFLSI